MKLERLFALALLLLPACGSSPEAVCDHALALLEKENISAQVLDSAECLSDMSANKEQANFIQWARFSGCVTDTTSFEDVANCSDLLYQ